jgi:hemin uptake protein HemP
MRIVLICNRLFTLTQGLMQTPPSPPTQRPQAHTQLPAPSTPRPKATLVRSEDLLQGKDSVTLLHKGMCYTLRHTRQGKLILTK